MCLGVPGKVTAIFREHDLSTSTRIGLWYSLQSASRRSEAFRLACSLARD
jgi:hypothetical protein